jgi:hypothetical protein
VRAVIKQKQHLRLLNFINKKIAISRLLLTIAVGLPTQMVIKPSRVAQSIRAVRLVVILTLLV